MLFNSLEFLIFFIVSTIIYFIVPLKYRWVVLVLSSCVFFIASIPVFIIFVLITAINDYSVGILIEKYNARKKLFLLQSLIINLGILFFFKYFNFFSSNIEHLSKLIGWNYSLPVLSIIVPIGLSFYTFKSLSYTIEVYRGNQKAEHHIGFYILYVLFYPEILSGPIDRPQNLLHQLHNPPDFEYTRVTNGLKIIAWGLFQKLVVADRLALLVNRVYNNPQGYQGIQYVFVTFLFAIQIFCDFSGYTDIAIGVSKILGFNIIKNFDRPYFARSISEFWRKWHISLSSWLRDYLFLPIAYFVLRKLKNKPFLKIRPEYWSYCIAALLTMFIAGVWHGANWTFICWGIIMGFYLVFSFLTKKIRNSFIKSLHLNKLSFIHKFISTGITFSLTCFAWIFFRSNDMKEAVYIIRNLYTGFGTYLHTFINGIASKNFESLLQPFMLGLNSMELYLAVLFISLLFTIHIIQGKISIIKYLSEKPLLLRWTVYLIFIFVILVYGKFETRQFIYSQF